MGNLQDVKAKKEASLNLGGKTYPLRFTLNAMAEMEDRYGTVEDAFKALEASNFKAIRFMLWVGIAHGGVTLTETEVGDMIDMENLPELVKALGSVADSDLPAEDQSPNA